ncbi:hypothetical protein E4U39_004950 [Claviceps sp. Clav50 group G5]|nr:hypothetical protein E4U39_004950 [Claviceps sp. Clav50 group G5]
MDIKANCSDEALPDEDSSDEDLFAEEDPAALLARTPPTSLLEASILETFQRNPLLIKEDFDTEQKKSLSERMLAFEENQPVNDAEDSSDEDLMVTKDPTASVPR